MTTIAPSTGLIVGTVLALASWVLLGVLVVRWTRRPRRARPRGAAPAVGYRVDEAEVVQALDRRIQPVLPTEWPTPWVHRSSSISEHFEYVEVLELPEDMPRDAAIALVAEHANYALAGFSDGVSEDAREPYGGVVTIDGDLFRVRYKRLPHSHPDAGYLAPELEPIPISDIIIDD